MNLQQTGASIQQKEFQLPPLILHPFASAAAPAKLIQSSRASLMLEGLLPQGELSQNELDNILLDGRYQELRMLFYVGRDLTRWVEQCLDLAQRMPETFPQETGPLTFAAYLVEDAPAVVREKLESWGVKDYRSIFRRSLALNLIFEGLPGRELLSNEFVRNYYVYADALMARMLEEKRWARINSGDFTFVLYASGEYSRMLEREWEN